MAESFFHDMKHILTKSGQSWKLLLLRFICSCSNITWKQCCSNITWKQCLFCVCIASVSAHWPCMCMSMHGCMISWIHRHGKSLWFKTQVWCDITADVLVNWSIHRIYYPIFCPSVSKESCLILYKYLRFVTSFLRSNLQKWSAFSLHPVFFLYCPKSNEKKCAYNVKQLVIITCISCHIIRPDVLLVVLYTLPIYQKSKFISMHNMQSKCPCLTWILTGNSQSC